MLFISIPVDVTAVSSVVLQPRVMMICSCLFSVCTVNRKEKLPLTLLLLLSVFKDSSSGEKSVTGRANVHLNRFICRAESLLFSLRVIVSASTYTKGCSMWLGFRMLPGSTVCIGTECFICRWIMQQWKRSLWNLRITKASRSLQGCREMYKD